MKVDDDQHWDNEMNFSNKFRSWRSRYHTDIIDRNTSLDVLYLMDSQPEVKAQETRTYSSVWWEEERPFRKKEASAVGTK